VVPSEIKGRGNSINVGIWNGKNLTLEHDPTCKGNGRATIKAQHASASGISLQHGVVGVLVRLLGSRTASHWSVLLTCGPEPH
jgi:hypothetical protein